VLDASGRPLNRYPLAVEAAVDAESAYLVTWAMQQVVKQGTATWLKKRLPEDLTVAGKTGTTNGLRDSWFAGFSGDRVAVAWVGRDDNGPTKLSGSSGALRVWGDIMASIENQPLPELAPEGVEELRVDPANGLLAASGCGRALTVPFDTDGAPSATSGCGSASAAAPAPAPRQESQEPVVTEERKKSGGGLGAFFRSLLGN
jgi:penicillin-binding protein 1B